MESVQNEHLEVIMGLIIHGGNAKSLSMEAIYAAKSGNFEIGRASCRERV